MRGTEHSPFYNHVPQHWADRGADHYVIKRTPSFSSSYKLHHLGDRINDRRDGLEKTLITYRIGDETHDLFTLDDCFALDAVFKCGSRSNVMGTLRERVARRTLKHFLRTFSPHGELGTLLDIPEGEKRDGYILRNNDQYVMKVLHYPNIVILERTGQGKHGYQNIKELDGLFDYRYFRHQNLFVMESKSDKVKLDHGQLEEKLFEPLHNLFPQAQLHYVFFGNNALSTYRQNITILHPRIVNLHQFLLGQDVTPLYFSFSESKRDFEQMTTHLLLQYDLLHDRGVEFRGRIVRTPSDLIVWDHGQSPQLRLKKFDDGTWREVPVTKKKRKEKK
jgi:hypothetical protein